MMEGTGFPSFSIISGSVTGACHARSVAPRNNQDALFVRRTDSIIAGVVCDGVSATPYSEVGANLLARAAVADLVIRWGTSTNIEWRLQELHRVLSHAVLTTTAHMGIFLDSSDDVIHDYFLCTMVGFVMDTERTVVFSIGDGVWAINDDVHRIPPSPGNIPPCLAYSLTYFLEQIPASKKFTILGEFPTKSVNSLMIGSDGVEDFEKHANRIGPVSQFWHDNRYWENPVNLDRYMAKINAATPRNPDRLLHDDTTMVVVRRQCAICGSLWGDCGHDGVKDIVCPPSSSAPTE